MNTPTKLDDKTLASVNMLLASEHFHQLKAFFQASLEELDKNSRGLDGNELYRNQGRAQAFANLLELIAQAPETLKARRHLEDRKRQG